MTPTSNHVLNYILKKSGEDFALTLEQYVAYAYFGEKDIDDLDAEELQHVTQEFEEALAQLRGDE
jgi:hypothetical protein